MGPTFPGTARCQRRRAGTPATELQHAVGKRSRSQEACFSHSVALTLAADATTDSQAQPWPLGCCAKWPAPGCCKNHAVATSQTCCAVCAGRCQLSVSRIAPRRLGVEGVDEPGLRCGVGGGDALAKVREELADEAADLRLTAFAPTQLQDLITWHWPLVFQQLLSELALQRVWGDRQPCLAASRCLCRCP